MGTYLCYYELHVDERTFIVHVLVEAINSDEALLSLESQEGRGFHLQVKGVLGLATPETLARYMTPANCVGAKE